MTNPDFNERLEAAVLAQGGNAAEDDLLLSDVALILPGVSSPGVNVTQEVMLESATVGFHKPWDGVQAATAIDFDHEPDDVPLNEVAAWRLAERLGAPVEGLVAPCVLREIDGRAGSFVMRAVGERGRVDAPILARGQAKAAAFFDALIGQQDRHSGNFRFDDAVPQITLYDHGYCFPKAGSILNRTFFVDARQGGVLSPDLDEWEIEALDRLLGAPDLLGLAPMLIDERAEALRRRAQRMRSDGRILPPGIWNP
jgi:hypothetical protein